MALRPLVVAAVVATAIMVSSQISFALGDDEDGTRGSIRGADPVDGSERKPASDATDAPTAARHLSGDPPSSLWAVDEHDELEDAHLLLEPGMRLRYIHEATGYSDCARSQHSPPTDNVGHEWPGWPSVNPAESYPGISDVPPTAKPVDASECGNQLGSRCHVELTVLESYGGEGSGEWLLQLDIQDCTFSHLENGRPVKQYVPRDQVLEEWEAREASEHRADTPAGTMEHLYELYFDPFLFVQSDDGAVSHVFAPPTTDSWVLSTKRGMVAAFHSHLPSRSTPRARRRMQATVESHGGARLAYYAVDGDVDETGRFTARYAAVDTRHSAFDARARHPNRALSSVATEDDQFSPALQLRKLRTHADYTSWGAGAEHEESAHFFVDHFKHTTLHLSTHSRTGRHLVCRPPCLSPPCSGVTSHPLCWLS